MTTSSFFTNRMHLTDEGVALYVDAMKLKRTTELPKEMLKHVEYCPDCQLQIVELYELLKNEVYEPSLKHPYFDRVQEPEVRYGSVIYRVAAVLAGVALLGIGYYFLSTTNVQYTPSPLVETDQSVHRKERPQNIKQQEHITQEKTPTQQQDFAANFIESPNLEDLVQTQFRSIAVEVITPKAGDVVQQPVVFKWKGVDEPLTIKILSNKEQTLATANITTNTYTTKKILSPGLYYWKLETKDEVIYVGKFLVK